MGKETFCYLKSIQQRIFTDDYVVVGNEGSEEYFPPGSGLSIFNVVKVNSKYIYLNQWDDDDGKHIHNADGKCIQFGGYKPINDIQLRNMMKFFIKRIATDEEKLLYKRRHIIKDLEIKIKKKCLKFDDYPTDALEQILTLIDKEIT